MIKKMSMGLIGLAILSVNAQTINLQGVVSNAAGKPVSNAVVSLVRQKMKDTTGTDGKYSFVSTSVRKLSSIVPQMNDIKLNNGVLQFELSAQSPVKVEIFDLKGKLLRQEINTNAAAGTYRYDISNYCNASKVLVFRAAIGTSALTFRYMPLQNGKFVLSPVSEVSSSFNRTGLAPIADVVDTITVTANGYKTKSVAITSLSMQQNIALDTNATGGKNDPVPSAGCGKAVGNVGSSGTVSTVSGRGAYRIKFPANYDKDKPYRLIFAMHCMGASSQDIAGTTARGDGAYNYYGLGSIATDAILIAPEGNSGGTWNPKSDEQFFSDLLKKLKNDFCIDTSRVFVCGFSFGAMYTYALSVAFPKQIRAVACYAPANWNFDPQPTNNHIPIAYYQTTGTNDGRCNWIFNDGQKKGGKYCLLQHVEDNGCDANQEIKLATGGTHETTEFKGCDEGYPVKFSSFKGDHTAGESWIPTETWNFFKQF